MYYSKSFTILLIIVGVSYGDNKFPKDFQFGVATGAVQHEGGWNDDGKGESIWDIAAHNNLKKILENANADVASDGYHKYKEDVALLKFLGVDFYRFSISWPRILPNGKSDSINQLGINYYKNLINELVTNGIEPQVTMYFWDLPQPLQDEGGWRNEAMIDYFVDYAKILFTHFGDQVKNWITFNEVLSICVHGYETGILAPFLNDTGIGGYECTRIVLLAHAKTHALYSKEFRKEQKGEIGIALDSPWFEPKDPDTEEDRKATDIALEMTVSL